MAATRKRTPEKGARLRATLEASLCDLSRALPRAPRIVVGFSGGLDSSVLLDLLAGARRRLRLTLSAVHVHHGLSVNADAWARHCELFCGERNVSLAIARVSVPRRARSSLEEEARRARYRVLSAVDADFLALAHHADDQAETVLLQLLRGAGPQGLSAMPEARATSAHARPWRPLLGIPRADIEAYARSAQLAWVEDESNADLALRRNFVRHRVLPLLASTFPAPVRTLARSASLQAEAVRLLEELAREDLAKALDGEGLVLAVLASFNPARRANLLRHWLAEAGLRAPSNARLQSLVAACDSRAAKFEWRHGKALVLRRGNRLMLAVEGPR